MWDARGSKRFIPVTVPVAGTVQLNHWKGPGDAAFNSTVHVQSAVPQCVAIR